MIFESLLIEVFLGGLQILIFVSLVVELNGHDDMEGHDNKALFGAVKTRSEISSLVCHGVLLSILFVLLF